MKTIKNITFLVGPAGPADVKDDIEKRAIGAGIPVEEF